jgi:hypothetical protein
MEYSTLPSIYFWREIKEVSCLELKNAMPWLCQFNERNFGKTSQCDFGEMHFQVIFISNVFICSNNTSIDLTYKQKGKNRLIIW